MALTHSIPLSVHARVQTATGPAGGKQEISLHDMTEFPALGVQALFPGYAYTEQLSSSLVVVELRLQGCSKKGSAIKNR